MIRCDHNPVSALATDKRHDCYERIVPSILATVLGKRELAVRPRPKATGRSQKEAGVPPKG